MDKAILNKSSEKVKPELTQKRLKKLLHYNPLDGKFTWNAIGMGRKSNRSAGSNHSGGYIEIGVDYKSYKASRLAFLYMEGYFPEHQVDHINRIRNDNRWENLREVTHQCNMRNSKVPINNESGVKGVHWDTRDKCWVSQMGGGKKKKTEHLGCFKSLKDAAKARWVAEVKYGYPNCNTTSTAYLYLQQS